MMIANTSYNGNSFLPLSLVEIKLMNCTKCERIPTLGNLPFLKSLEISGMFNLKCIGTEFYSGYSNGDSDRRLAFFPSLQKLVLKKMPNLVEWKEVTTTTEGAAVFPSLEELSICECEELQIVPRHFPSLRKLRIEGIKSGKPIVDISSMKTSTLTHLNIKNVPELGFLPLENNKNLVRVSIRECPMLTCISPNGLHAHVALESLEIVKCPNLTSIPSIQGLTSLKDMWINGCHGLTSLPIRLGSCTSLEKLVVSDCGNLISNAKEEEEEDLSELSSLVNLVIIKCPKLESWPLDRFPHRLPKLELLGIGGFGEELDSLPLNLNLNIDSFPQLDRLRLRGWPKLKYLPDQLQHLTTLTYLSLADFEGLEVLPDWLGNLSSLDTLRLGECANLKYLPSVESMQRLTNLISLSVSSCPLLEERCNKGSGPEWSKISHIPYIEINRRRIE